ncbi:hypothetical protein SCLCIDRAFT_178163 [Scleroderma citrinum Foug A]|uniref:Uncharacterized protein n=1 Tax=Scleroderma citrinum Foug A TaxID=1036808 RepID=A0A0C3ESW3_9AGAM|nr:hypothetical protein SCLCIDRAFT_178163 [Scleroderma citrinum Foug A]
MKLFWTAFAGMFLWQIIPSYISPLLGGLSIFCLASQHLPPHMQDIFTNLFGGVVINEGLGLLSICLDWSLISLYYMTIPLISQANSWVGFGVCYILLPVIYYANIWNSKNFPMLSTLMFHSNGSIFNPSSSATTSAR